MRFYVAVTDNQWFEYLARLQPDEVNFWRPSGLGFRAVESGSLFLFKLHSPLNFIAGGGFLVRAERLPLSLAWDAFEEKNGAANCRELERLIRAHRGWDEPDPEIGCIILNQPFFLRREEWIPVPKDWKANIVSGKSYDTEDVVGRRLWDTVLSKLQAMSPAPEESNQPAAMKEELARYGREYLMKCRLGQGAFRVLVTGAYKRRCAISGERTLPVLEAAHIKPFADSGPNRTENGLLLRSDMHILFDKGYLTVTPDYRVEVSRRIKEEFENGRDYYSFHGKRLVVVPGATTDRPNKEFLDWHNSHVYRV